MSSVSEEQSVPPTTDVEPAATVTTSVEPVEQHQQQSNDDEPNRTTSEDQSTTDDDHANQSTNDPQIPPTQSPSSPLTTATPASLQSSIEPTPTAAAATVGMEDVQLEPTTSSSPAQTPGLQSQNATTQPPPSPLITPNAPTTSTSSATSTYHHQPHLSHASDPTQSSSVSMDTSDDSNLIPPTLTSSSTSTQPNPPSTLPTSTAAPTISNSDHFSPHLAPAPSRTTVELEEQQILEAAKAAAATGGPTTTTTPQPKKSPLSRAMARSQPVMNSTGDTTHCPCGDNTDQEGFMIQCESCEIWQHGHCIGLTEKTTPDQYYCEMCDRENPIHQLFRERWGDKTPVKGKPNRKTKNNKSKEYELPPVSEPTKPASTTSKNAKEKKSTARAGAKESTTSTAKSGDASSTDKSSANMQPPSNKRKRTEESTPKPPRTGSVKKLDEASANSPDLTKRPRLENQDSTGSASHVPSTPSNGPIRNHQSTGEYDYPASGATSGHSTAIVNDLAALAAELGPDGLGGDLTPAGSREARKIQRYIQMIQKMENTTKKASGGAGSKEEELTEGQEGQMEDDDDAQLGPTVSSTGQPSSQPPPTPLNPQLDQVYGGVSDARRAREARAKLRAEKIQQLEGAEGSGEGEGGATASSGTAQNTAQPASGTSAATAAAAAAREKKKKVGGKAQVRKEEEVPVMTPVEIRTARRTTTTQLRPLGPMYFGRKQLLLQSYRDEALRCETGFSITIHEEVPMKKRILHHYRLTTEEHQHPTIDHHHHHSHPSTIFPPSHPWSIKHPHKLKALKAKQEKEKLAQQQQPQTQTHPDEEMSDGEEEDKPKPMDIDETEPQATAVEARAPTPTIKSEPLPAVGDFFASIDTSALPTKIQNLISSFSSSPQPPPIPPAMTLQQPADELDEAAPMDESTTGVIPMDEDERVGESVTTTTTFVDESKSNHHLIQAKQESHMVKVEVHENHVVRVEETVLIERKEEEVESAMEDQSNGPKSSSVDGPLIEEIPTKSLLLHDSSSTTSAADPAEPSSAVIAPVEDSTMDTIEP